MNSSHRLVCIAACAAFCGGIAQAQERGFKIGGIAEFIAGDPSVGPIVRDAPYSGEATTTVTQVLADGTRIERTTVARVFRDSQGRSRREQSVLGLGALNPAGDAASLVTIADPVAGVSYVLEPSTRTARRAAMQSKMEVHERRSVPPPPPPGPIALPRQAASGPPPPPPPPPAPMGQPLGIRQIEGIEAGGRRLTVTIEAGRIGNDRPIEIVDEVWDSPLLKVVLQSRHSDPRTGVVEYRLTNISRAEPPHDLFVVPPDYTIVEAREEKIEWVERKQ